VRLGKYGDAAAFLDFFPDGPAPAAQRVARTRARGGMVASSFVASGYDMAELFAGPLYTEALEVLRDDLAPT
jgi:hypothetical protein